MSELQPFSPDDEYCVYCHEPAAGLCAGCGALCCGECVDLVMGIATRRAICRQCLASGHSPAGTMTFLRLGTAIGAVLGAVLLLLVYLSR